MKGLGAGKGGQCKSKEGTEGGMLSPYNHSEIAAGLGMRTEHDTPI